MIYFRKRPREQFVRRVPRYWLELRAYREKIVNRHKERSQKEHEFEGMPRAFTLAEAETLLPVLESLLRSAMESKDVIEKIDAEFEAVKSKVFLNGGTLLNVEKLAKRKAEREQAVQRAKDAVAEIDATGVQVKDLDIGLLDFPCEVDGEIILLCWKLGEKGITHWHGSSEGFAGRKPIDDRIRRGAKKTN